jgi:hypothetical protein
VEIQIIEALFQVNSHLERTFKERQKDPRNRAIESANKNKVTIFQLMKTAGQKKVDLQAVFRWSEYTLFDVAAITKAFILAGGEHVSERIRNARLAVEQADPSRVRYCDYVPGVLLGILEALIWLDQHPVMKFRLCPNREGKPRSNWFDFHRDLDAALVQTLNWSLLLQQNLESGYEDGKHKYRKYTSRLSQAIKALVHHNSNETDYTPFRHEPILLMLHEVMEMLEHEDSKLQLTRHADMVMTNICFALQNRGDTPGVDMARALVAQLDR